MPYTLMKGLAWVLLAVLLGIVIGWLLRSVAARRQIERAKRGRAESDDHAEIEQLQARVANLEPVVNERDRLRAELEQIQAERSIRPGPDPGVAMSASAAVAAAAPSDDASPPVDVAAAESALGARIELDDLTAIEGIGPNIAELCHGIGIRTWAELSTTEVSLLRTMLDDAGHRFKTHDPSTWPDQARLLAAGDWSGFAALTEQLDSSRPTA